MSAASRVALAEVRAAQRRVDEEDGRVAHCRNLLTQAKDDLHWARFGLARAKAALREAARKAWETRVAEAREAKGLRS